MISLPRLKLLATVAVAGTAALTVSCARIGTSAIQDLDSVPAISSTSAAESEMLREYYIGVEERLISKGFLRTDDGYSEPPLSIENLVDNFERQVFFHEHAFKDGRFIPLQVRSVLKKWQKPVRIRIVNGESILPHQKASDRESVAEFAARLGDLTGLRIELSDRNPNFYVLFLSKGEQQNFVRQLQILVPDISEKEARDYLNSEARHFCSVLTIYDLRRGNIQQAVVLIKAEHPPLMRLACIHEEMAQALGIVNDSIDARPSIFNDDEEFALLTYHDEIMLKILYDKRLSPGMTTKTARPIVKSIASELVASR